MTHTLGLWLVAIPCSFLIYSYVAYPALVWLLSRLAPDPTKWGNPPEWPEITIILPCYNEERSVAATIESLLALDYPAEKRQILVISDASSDRTDDIVHSYGGRGVELLRVPARGGKTAAENAAGPYLRGEIIVNTDATTRILSASLKKLVREFQDPTIGVATGRATSVGDLDSAMNRSEAGYLSYEMWVRSLETRAGTIVGASGCFFAIRRILHDSMFPVALSRDFASCLIAREHGYRAVSVAEAVCLVPLSSSVRNEYRRKVRTMARGLDTLWFKRQLLNPWRQGRFAFMLFSHKLCRWLFQLTFPLIAVGLLLQSIGRPWAGVLVAGGFAALALIAAVTIRWPQEKPMPWPLSMAGFAIWANAAGLVAWIEFIEGHRNPIWEPTRRPDSHPGNRAAQV